MSAVTGVLMFVAGTRVKTSVAYKCTVSTRSGLSLEHAYQYETDVATVVIRNSSIGGGLDDRC